MNNNQSLKLLESCVKHKIPAFLVGPAGSGKTTVAENVAKKFGMDFYCMSVGNQTTKSDLLGFISATGNYVSTVFRTAFEEGGVFLLDEIDAGNSNVLTILNSALANGYCSFPDGMVKRHKNFCCIASGNTIGQGANKQYVGRNQLDGATLDRFTKIDWTYDEVLEKKISKNNGWTNRVQAIRKICNDMGLKLIISPRASINGSNLINDGIPVLQVDEACIFKGQIDEITKQKIYNLIPREIIVVQEIVKEEVLIPETKKEIVKETPKKTAKKPVKKTGEKRKRNFSPEVLEAKRQRFIEMHAQGKLGKKKVA
jgi:cobaltochelatase CobS